MSRRPLSVIVAEGVSIDQLTSRVTAFNMYEVVPVNMLPSLLLRVNVVTLYEMTDEPALFAERVTFRAPDGTTVLDSENTVSIAARMPGRPPNAHRSIHTLWRVRLETEGDYRFVVAHRPVDAADDAEWVGVTSMLFTVHQQQHPLLNTESELRASTPPAEPK